LDALISDNADEKVTNFDQVPDETPDSPESSGYTFCWVRDASYIFGAL